MKKKILALAFVAAMIIFGTKLYAESRQWSICTTETINCFNQKLQPAGSHMVMACGDTWAEWGEMLDEYAEMFCGHSAWGLH